MESIVAINPLKKESFEFEKLGTVRFGKENILFGKVNLPKPAFESEKSENLHYVLLKVTAFSCNYRDKAILAETYSKIKNSERLFFPFGSEFNAVVAEKGKAITEFEIGEHVMPNCAYPESGISGLIPGVTTNFASLGWLRIHKNKITKVPTNLTEAEIACFSLGTQTAASMVRRSGILYEGGKPLVFSARSATSLFIIQQLIDHGFTPLCLTTTEWSEKEKQAIYPAKIELLSNFLKNESKKSHQFTHVFDPFFDMNIGLATYYLTMGGTYITCGLRNQHSMLSTETPQDLEPIVRGGIKMSILKNLTIIGNCLGTTEDLLEAINRRKKFSPRPIVDSIYRIEEGAKFVQRSFFERNRFGKCVLSYSTSKDKEETE